MKSTPVSAVSKRNNRNERCIYSINTKNDQHQLTGLHSQKWNNHLLMEKDDRMWLDDLLLVYSSWNGTPSQLPALKYDLHDRHCHYLPTTPGGFSRLILNASANQVHEHWHQNTVQTVRWHPDSRTHSHQNNKLRDVKIISHVEVWWECPSWPGCC